MRCSQATTKGQRPGAASLIETARLNGVEPYACLNLSANDCRITKAVHEHPAPTLEQIRHVPDTMPASSDIELRDRTLIAFTILTGARDNAIVSLSLRLARSLLIGTLSGRRSTWQRVGLLQLRRVKRHCQTTLRLDNSTGSGQVGLI